MIAGLCVVAVAIPIALAISAVWFRAGCAVYNRMCQPENRVPSPTFGTALLIAIPMVAVKLVIRAGLTVVVLSMFDGLSGVERLIKAAASLGSVPFAILATAAMAAWLLPTTYTRALLATLLTYVIGLILALALLVIIMMAVFAIRLAG